MTMIGKPQDVTLGLLRGAAVYGTVAGIALFVLACPVAMSTSDWGPVIAWGLTFGPGALIVSQAWRFRDPSQATPFVVLSTLLRVALAAGGGLVILQLVPAIPRRAFLVWLGGMYLLALAAEIYVTMSVNSLWKLGRISSQAASSTSKLPEAGR
jgi:hypothetical protein